MGWGFRVRLQTAYDGWWMAKKGCRDVGQDVTGRSARAQYDIRMCGVVSSGGSLAGHEIIKSAATPAPLARCPARGRGQVHEALSMFGAFDDNARRCF